MTNELKNQIIEHLHWLGEQIGNEVEIVDKLSSNKGNYNRHFTRTSQFTFVIEHFGVAFSGAMARISGKHIHFEFKTDLISRIERKEDLLEIELMLDINTSRLILFQILN
ncbi:MAG: hypothetical protein AB8G22_15180 [Saprospiraceae bacterium]